MRLQTLEIKGFKSFADKTIVNFNKDIIGIVGPNGCGKSNIVDAIRWVLGEQKSSQLRSDKMSNVIFNGTKTRKQGGIAEVSLTFDNDKGILPTEYATVTVTRQLFRTGDSEYRINGVSCRLKDINTLFLDTGIGSNSYAIIALGMVDDLLADRENSRRRLFEQAAGISKYKARKKETLLKLEGTTTDLDRVEDLLFEIDGNLKKLERQAKRAKKYFELKEEYKMQSIDLAVFEIAEHKTSYKNLEQQINKEEYNLLNINTKTTVLEANLEKAKADNLEQEQHLNDRQKQLNQTIGNIRNKEHDKKMLLQKVSFIETNKLQIEKEIQTTAAQIEQTTIDIDYYREEINAEKRLEGVLETQLENVESRLDGIRKEHSNIKAALDDFIKNQQVLEKEIFGLEKDKAVQTVQVSNLEQSLVQLKKEQEEKTKEIKILSAQQTEQQQEQAVKEAIIQQLQTTETERQQQLSQTEELLEVLKNDLNQVNRQLDAKRNEYNLLKSLVENLEGFPESIKFLNKNKQWNKKIPLFSDIFYCLPDYRVALESYLEPYLSYYIVDNLEEALKAIQLLDDAKKGKANFFLLDTFKDKTTTIKNSVENSIHALEVVQLDAVYQALGQHILGNVWISESEEVQPTFLNENITILSKSGKYIQKQYAITGGSVGAFEGKRIGRKKNLEILIQEIDTLTTTAKESNQSILQLQQQYQQLKAADKQHEIKKQVELLNKMQQEGVSIQTKLDNFEAYFKETTFKETNFKQQITEKKEKIKGINEQLLIKQMDNKRLTEQIVQKDESFRTIAERLNKVSQEFNQQNITFIKQQNKITSLQRELNFREKQARDLSIKLETTTRNLSKIMEEAAQATQNIQQLDEELRELYSQKTKNQSALTTAEEVFFKSKANINETEDEIRKLNRLHLQTQQVINQLKEQFNEVKMKLTAIGERLRIEFDVDINEVINQNPSPDWQRASLEDAVDKLKTKIINYGEINPMAVEAYNEMNERYIFIKSQRDDLLAAKQTLLDTIQEIEMTATEQFMTAFNEVRSNFKKVFRTLFTEDDDCDLLLEDPTNPLESTIKITAKPKGKRPQTINQLSGGEKTLTATALLFSLYLLKPAPFCIFDEVDAPLDDANVAKFNKIIKEFSKESQFIIVTHNKQTMAEVDVIYGVTMQEQGVSRVVAVDFRTLSEENAN